MRRRRSILYAQAQVYFVCASAGPFCMRMRRSFLWFHAHTFSNSIFKEVLSQILSRNRILLLKYLFEYLQLFIKFDLLQQLLKFQLQDCAYVHKFYDNKRQIIIVVNFQNATLLTIFLRILYVHLRVKITFVGILIWYWNKILYLIRNYQQVLYRRPFGLFS